MERRKRATFQAKPYIGIQKEETSSQIKKEYTYNIEKYGCPIRVHYKSPFKPTIEVYLGLKYLGVVHANYIIWEEHRRTDFFYNTTMEQVGCLREAQTWESMLSHSVNYKHIGDAWGPENYRSCYETPGLIRNMHRSYEILNSSNSVFITWPTDHTGIYLFTVKVLDSNYSFCKLTAHFAVDTYGVVNRGQKASAKGKEAGNGSGRKKDDSKQLQQSPLTLEAMSKLLDDKYDLKNSTLEVLLKEIKSRLGALKRESEK
ncbi:cation channel sperm-associated auxiliary subunit epsilon-like [Hemitrygon akajei]|uniref:cation channel sperm-associated auxiliary subunit epsilon-like n=1 Tax=Hemitrygon akajei TaxID=2704970 RepID=UPI003BF97321